MIEGPNELEDSDNRHFLFDLTGNGEVTEIRIKRNKLATLEDLFGFLSFMASQDGPVICQDFLPYMDLVLSDTWETDESLLVLHNRWKMVEELLMRQSELADAWLFMRHEVGHGFVEFHRRDGQWDFFDGQRFRFIRPAFSRQ